MTDRSPINVAIVGVGNCASSLVQGLTYCRGRNDEDAAGLIPVVDGGRVKPLDTAARVDMRVMSTREEFEDAVADALDETVRWIKSHRIDVVLVDPLYTASMAADADYNRIVEAVRLVAAGQSILSPSVTAGVLASVREARRSGGDSSCQAARERLAALTDRELEVAQAVGAGMSNAEISRELYLSVATVKAHVGRILDKLGADNRVQVAITVHDAELDTRP